MSQNTSVLLVSADDTLCAELTRELASRAVVRCLTTWREAMACLGATRWAAIVLDVDDDPSLEFWATLRAQVPTAPALVLLASTSPRAVNLAQRHRVEVLAKPVPRAPVLSFVRRAMTFAEGLTAEDIRAWTKVLTLRYSLSNAEADLFDLVLDRESKEQVMARWNAPWQVVHEVLLSMLRKCEARTAESLSKSVLVNAVLYRIDPELAVHGMRLVHGDEDDEELEAEGSCSTQA